MVGLFAGKRKRNNDFLGELQTSIDLLSAKNKNLIHDVINLRDEVVQLRTENAILRKEIEELSGKISSVQTITQKKPKESKK
jgi:regulator of replication initiation timing